MSSTPTYVGLLVTDQAESIRGLLRPVGWTVLEELHLHAHHDAGDLTTIANAAPSPPASLFHLTLSHELFVSCGTTAWSPWNSLVKTEVAGSVALATTSPASRDSHLQLSDTFPHTVRTDTGRPHPESQDTVLPSIPSSDNAHGRKDRGPLDRDRPLPRPAAGRSQGDQMALLDLLA